jgi:hypothetical protein
MFAKLTETNGSYSLPVTRTIVRLDGIIEISPDNKRVNMSVLSPAERVAYGWYELVEDSFDDSYQSRGVYVDTINGTVINRSFPNPVPRDTAVLIADKEEALLALRNDKKSETDAEYANLMELVQIFARPAPPVDRVYVDPNGEPSLVNGTQANSQYDLLVDYRQAVDQAYKDKLDAVRVLTDPQTIVQFDINTGWP